MESLTIIHITERLIGSICPTDAKIAWKTSTICQVSQKVEATAEAGTNDIYTDVEDARFNLEGAYNTAMVTWGGGGREVREMNAKSITRACKLPFKRDNSNPVSASAK